MKIFVDIMNTFLEKLEFDILQYSGILPENE